MLVKKEDKRDKNIPGLLLLLRVTLLLESQRVGD
jgi:hypothetical protein